MHSGHRHRDCLQWWEVVQSRSQMLQLETHNLVHQASVVHIANLTNSSRDDIPSSKVDTQPQNKYTCSQSTPKSRHVYANSDLAYCWRGAGETCAIRELEAELPLSGVADFGFQDDLHTQLFLPAPRYVLVHLPHIWGYILLCQIILQLLYTCSFRLSIFPKLRFQATGSGRTGQFASMYLVLSVSVLRLS